MSSTSSSSSTTKVHAMNPSSSSKTKTIQNTTDTEGTLINKTPLLMKLLTIICVGQVFMITVTAATLGVYVKENVKEIDALKQMAGTLKVDMAFMMMNNTEVESRMSKLETDQESNPLELQGLTSRFLTHQTEMEGLRSEIGANFTVQTCLIRAQSDGIEKQRNNIQQLANIIGRQNASIQSAYERLSALDANMTDSQLDLQFQDSKINDTTLNVLSSRIASLELDKIEQQVVLLNQSLRIGELESDFVNITTYIEEHASKLTQIESDMNSNHANILHQVEYICNNNNVTLQSLTSRMTQLEWERSAYEDEEFNLTRRVNEIEDRSQLNNLTIHAHDTRISLLEPGIVLSQERISNHTSRIHDIEISLASTNTSLENTNSILSGIISELKSNQYVRINDSDSMRDLTGYLLENVIPIQTISNNTERVQQLQRGIEDQNSTLTELAAIIQRSSYAFSAYDLSGASSSSVRTKLVFAKTKMNENSVYNTATGRFTAPTDGVYIFHTTLHVFDAKKYIHIAFVAGEKIIGHFMVGDDYWDTSSSGSAIARLEKGTEVSMRVEGVSGGLTFREDGAATSIFSGYLVSA